VSVALSPDGSPAYVADVKSGDVSVIDTDTLATSGKVGSTPRGIAVAAT
jgi:YVTN family beta-propeller protein